MSCNSAADVWELPPRARRIQAGDLQIQVGLGTTSACAENTTLPSLGRTCKRNYLRVRGEYSISDAELLEQLELPPRARRIHQTGVFCPFELGTTSACAENTALLNFWDCNHRNYLRVRGEYYSRGAFSVCTLELPPRARRIRSSRVSENPTPGTTSACAENTGYHISTCRYDRNYLRVRGEYSGVVECPRLAWELPPRARRIPGVIYGGSCFV